jgi:hypothetical protein
LDAILVTDNPYTDTQALSVGVGYKNGKLIKRSGNYWQYNSSYVDKDIVVRSSANIVPIGTSSKTYWESKDCVTGWVQNTKTTGEYIPTDATIANCIYNNATGLYTDACNGGFKDWSPATSYCSAKGMRLPTLYETRAKVSGGISSCGHNTWTSTNTGDSGWYYVWNGTSIDKKRARARMVRCVR